MDETPSSIGFPSNAAARAPFPDTLSASHLVALLINLALEPWLILTAVEAFPKRGKPGNAGYEAPA